MNTARQTAEIAGFATLLFMPVRPRRSPGRDTQHWHLPGQTTSIQSDENGIACHTEINLYPKL